MLCKAEPPTADGITAVILLPLFQIEYSFCELPTSPDLTYGESHGTQLSPFIVNIDEEEKDKPLLEFIHA
jgi:hypothetical protein